TMDAIEASLEAGPEARTAELCRELIGRLERHNAKEEAVIYPEADSVLDPRAAARLRAFLDTGRAPEGWVCRNARPPAARRRGPA
ncbi:MAG TPA: hypothetical protein VFG74_06120, partial [Miltoncostaeaceae bacterium]|nr:hypothetical protein [Miltoncostaeaceae bacterium]